MTEPVPPQPPKITSLDQYLKDEQQVAIINCEGCPATLATPHLKVSDALVYAHVLGWKRIGQQDFCQKCAVGR